MNILITGIQGFVGSNFTKAWSKKHTLYGLDINRSAKEGVKELYAWEQLGEIPEVDAIVHLAGKAHDTKNKSLSQEYFDINTGLTQKIFDYFLQSKAQTFIFFSSVKAAADTVEGEMLTEEVAPRPIGPYGESKIKAETYILNMLNTNSTTQDKHIYILRPAMIHGPGNKGNLNLLYQVVKKGIPWFLGAFENKRSFCSIDNIIYATEQLILRKDITNGIYHVCDDDAISTNELIRLIAASEGKTARILNIPRGVVQMLASMGSLLHLPLNRERLKKLTENYIVSNEKIKRALNISAFPTKAQEGLSKTFDSFKLK